MAYEFDRKAIGKKELFALPAKATYWPALGTVDDLRRAGRTTGAPGVVIAVHGMQRLENALVVLVEKPQWRFVSINRRGRRMSEQWLGPLSGVSINGYLSYSAIFSLPEVRVLADSRLVQ